jgi:hypothetical protein
MDAVATPAMISEAPQNPAMSRFRRQSAANSDVTALAPPASAAGRNASSPNVRKFIGFIAIAADERHTLMIGGQHEILRRL